MDNSSSDMVEQVLGSEAQALQHLSRQVRSQAAAINAVCALVVARCGEGRSGRLVTTGVGKAGIIARKVSATFASTGTPGFFLHPSEALHGDLGMVSSHDVILAFSNSGASDEITALLPSFAHLGVTVIAITGRSQGPLAQHADYSLLLGDLTEACPLGLAPSTTTTAMLALGDALAMAVHAARHFTPEQYARFHPGGALGRKLMTCQEAMRKGDRLALVQPATPLLEAMRAIGHARAGSAVVVDDQGCLQGILTDGDIRRAITRTHDQQQVSDVVAQPLVAYATIPCRSIASKDLLSAALHRCHQYKINELPVINDDQQVVGLIDIQDLISRGFDIPHAQG
ncbi:MAG: KpsF/GutQ family sugar-phosphate isomerase [Planctomycetota bacterium]|nr:MAG: KpsF/GutQ family sugar-phosphate isomerase [Planctomycetota bacterium]